MQLPSWVPLNMTLLGNPYNWAVILSMAALGLAAFSMVSAKYSKQD